MPAPSVTNTFTNATTIDPSQVNQNFTDIINALTDGTKDFSISALTCAGAVNLQAAVTLGASTSNDLTVNGSLASNLAIKTNNTYGIGSSTIGLSGVYLGAPSSRTTRIRAHQSLGASNTLILPDGNGNANEVLQTDGSGNLSWVKNTLSANDLKNIGVTASVNTGALTVTLQGAAATLSTTNPAIIPFRNSTAATGTPTELRQTSDLTCTLTSGSTLGLLASQNIYLYLYAIYNAGTPLLGLSACYFDEGELNTVVTAEGGAGAADLNSKIYASTTVASSPIRLLARLKFNLSVAGTWLAPTEISLRPFTIPEPYARYTSTSGQSIANGSVVTLIMGTISKDTHGAYNPTTGEFTCPNKGTFTVKVHVKFGGANWTNGNDITLFLYKNGSFYSYIAVFRSEVTQGTGVFVGGSDDIDCAAGDVLTVRVSHGEASARTLEATAGINRTSFMRAKE